MNYSIIVIALLLPLDLRADIFLNVGLKISKSGEFVIAPDAKDGWIPKQTNSPREKTFERFRPSPYGGVKGDPNHTTPIGITDRITTTTNSRGQVTSVIYLYKSARKDGDGVEYKLFDFESGTGTECTFVRDKPRAERCSTFSTRTCEVMDREIKVPRMVPAGYNDSIEKEKQTRLAWHSAHQKEDTLLPTHHRANLRKLQDAASGFATFETNVLNKPNSLIANGGLTEFYIMRNVCGHDTSEGKIKTIKTIHEKIRYAPPSGKHLPGSL